MKLLPGNSQQALRCRRVLMASVAYLLWVAVTGYLYSMGLLTIGPSALAAYYLGILATNVAIFGAVWSGLNLRIADPSLTVPQMVVAIIWAMVLLTAAVPGVRGLMLLLFTSTFFFGIFRLRTRQFIALAVFAIALYGGLVVLEADHLSSRQLQVEITQVLVLGAVLIWMSFMGGYVARLRRDLRRALRQIEELARTDDLTGTENRRSISAALRDAMASARKTGRRLAICLLDLDHFKRVNDTHGHLVGDAVLREFVVRVQRELRDRDLLGRGPWPGALGRFGGEEFLVVLRDSDEPGARLAAERIRQAVCAAPFLVSTESGAGARVAVTVSAGVAGWYPGESEVDLLRRADRALYQAKEAGRNRVYLAPPVDCPTN